MIIGPTSISSVIMNTAMSHSLFIVPFSVLPSYEMITPSGNDDGVKPVKPSNHRSRAGNLYIHGRWVYEEELRQGLQQGQEEQHQLEAMKAVMGDGAGSGKKRECEPTD